ncbi:hypothetical protein JNB63_07090 [Microbacterium trichothecenolyticum]|uniref:Uncharacterized protein n=1 Tax=Microbacterium ureisolvens TaxID=2781186 RepID=A0ABS7HW48_9MICO|nr:MULTISPECIES: hypothetical protein [Microbacterium]MBW9109025.1 hypothetical protein [Microbacterium ureisolvens]MBW9119852.1 hypothetical protein [Microbacterium trichothecenolyticum]
MGTVEVVYGGESYRISGRTLEDVQHQIDDILALGTSGWIEALDGHGTRSPYRLLITPGVPVCIAALPTE